MTVRVLIVEDSPGVLEGISSTLLDAGYETFTAQSGTEALDIVDDIRPDVVLLDIVMPGMDGYEVCRRLRQKPLTSETPIMMLTAMESVEHKIRGFEAGADDYLVKPFNVAELYVRIEALLRRASKPKSPVPPKPASKIIACFSLRGGVGTSTLAVNLAIGLAQLWGCKTVLVDLAFTSGQAALMLNLHLDHTWTSLASVSVDEMDVDVIEGALLEHPSGVHVLAAPSQPEEENLIKADQVTHTLSMLSKRFQYVILDLPHNFQDTTLAGLDVAHQILAVMAPEMASVRAMSSALQVFRMLAYPLDKVQLILNRTWPYGLGRRSIEETLKRHIAYEIPFTPKEFISSINLGIPLILEAPDSRIVSLLEDLTFQLSAKEHKEWQPKNPSEAWQRVMERKRKRGRTGDLVKRALGQLGPQISFPFG